MKPLLTHLAALAALCMVGCGKPPTPVEHRAEAEPQPSPGKVGAPLEGPLAIYCRAQDLPQEVVGQFTAETGVEVTVETYSTMEEMLARLLAGGGPYDVLQAGEIALGALVKDGFLLPLDRPTIPNLSQIAPLFLNLAADPDNKFSVPFLAGTVGIAYNTEAIKEPIADFADVFRSQNAGRIVVLDDAREIVSWGFLARGIPVNQVNDENLANVKPLLAGWLPMVKIYDSETPADALRRGDVAISIMRSSDAAPLLAADKKFAWVQPPGGSHLFVESLVVPKSARHPDAAMAFLNFILRPEIGKKLAGTFPGLSPNTGARALLTPEQLGNAASYPPESLLQNAQIFEDIGRQGAKVEELVTSLKVQ